ncbi:uncharacterized protein N7511_006855 [Penicillium nucicola]|uniref:uncharacterized protein n=1 Tax=Penicillium nucicola TaxID=1850975 RepID=UPI0025454118|nr:uncharacterized protein N7511_006855 [Penicillium nucicola]KAJ5758161.1 hypothetical protein N7511_006855 [Penicillium nucicola]
MRNSEESSTSKPAPSFFIARRRRSCPRGPETSGGEEERAPAFFFLEPHGRVGAEIVCDDTLVQYAAYLLCFFLHGGSGWYHSIPIILVGMALPFFFSQVSFRFLLPLFCLVWECWKGFFCDLANL